MVQQNLPTQLSILFSFFRMFQVPWQSPARTWLATQLPERPMRGPSIGHRLFEALGALGPLPCDFDAVNAREVHLPTKKHQKKQMEQHLQGARSPTFTGRSRGMLHLRNGLKWKLNMFLS